MSPPVGRLTGTPGYGGGRLPAKAPGRAPAHAAAKAPVNPIVALVNQILAMQEKPLTQAESLRQQQVAQQQQQIENTTHGIIGALQAGIGPASQAYDTAIQQTSDLAKTASGLFQAANPDAANQATLKAIGAPQAQQQQVAGLDASLFNGGPNYVLGGQIPGAQLAGQKAAQVGFLAGLPASYAAQGQVGSANLRVASDTAHQAYLSDVQKILATAPQLVQQYQAAAKADSYKQAQLNLERQTLGLKTDTAAGLDPVTGQPLPRKPDPSLSKVYNHVVDANGVAILDANGNQIPVYRAPKTGLTPAQKQAQKDAAAHKTALKNRGTASASYTRQVLGVPTAVSKKVTTGQGLLQTTTTVKTQRQYNAILTQAMGLPEVQILTGRFGLTPAQVRALAVRALASKGIRRPAKKTMPTTNPLANPIG